MGDIKLQIGCLTVIVYISIMYIRDTCNKNLSCNKYFDMLLALAPLAVVFDGLTFITVNKLEVVSTLVNKLFHLAFFLLMELVIITTSLYMYEKIIGFHNSKKEKLCMYLPGIILILITIGCVGDLEFIVGKITNYSHGISVYMCFITVALYYGYIILMVLTHWRFIQKAKRTGILSFLAIVGVLIVVQLIFPELLLTSVCTTMMLLGIYIVFENPAFRIIELQNEKMVDSFATLVESKDSNTGGHIKRTRLYVQLLLKKMRRHELYSNFMSKDYITAVIEAAPLHDIGKISTPDEILQKPGKLTDQEYAIMKQHAACGGDIILNTFKDMYSAEVKKIVVEVARHHHEKFNGKGYPDGIAGEDIPLHARVMAIADVFDAVSQRRCYREAMALDDCFAIIENGAGSDFDPNLVKLFMDAKDEVIELFEQNKDA